MTNHHGIQLRPPTRPVARPRQIRLGRLAGVDPRGDRSAQRADGTARGLRLNYWPGRDQAPWAFYLPGSFQGAADEDSHRMVEMLREQGYRVVLIPDPLGREYMASSPVAPPASYAREAGIVRDAIAEVLKRMGGDQVRVIAASHGAFLAAMTWALDQRAERPLIADVSLLFPQADLGHAVWLIDRYISTPFVDDWPRATVGHVFRESLGRLVKRLQRTYFEDRRYGFVARSYPKRGAQALTQFRNAVDGATLTFRRVLDHFVARAEVLDGFNGRDDRLIHWLNEGHAARGSTNVRLLVGADDWTNAADAWADRPSWLRDGRHFATIARAGHAGLVSKPWFRRAVADAMSTR